MKQAQTLIANPVPRINRGEATAYSGNRDVALKALLGTDYEFANESGLLNDFYYNPDSGEDGLMHVLGGEYYVMADGTRVPSGFHHEPSADAAWVYNTDGERVEQPKTYVDRTHLEHRKARSRKDFIERPYEPYQARVVIDGLRKQTLSRNRQTGEVELHEANNGMFPKEYDALAVLQAIRLARDTRDRSEDTIDLKNQVIITDAAAPMLDGEHSMQIRLVLDAASDKVVSAYPRPRQTAMDLSRQEIKSHLGLDVE